MDKKTPCRIKCSECHWTGEEKDFWIKILAVGWNEQKKKIQAFIHIKCPKCLEIVTILMESIKP